MNEYSIEEKIKEKLLFQLNDAKLKERIDRNSIEKYYEAVCQLEKLKAGEDDSFDKKIREINLEAVIAWVETKIVISQPEPEKLINSQTHVSWLPNRRSEISWDYWECYKKLLSYEHGPAVLTRLDAVTDDILDCIKDPSTKGQWDSRGLVMGQVQSGKTLNYVGLINKAADAGYKIIVVLAGMHNNLRVQTQKRIDEGFIGKDTSNDDRPKIGVGELVEHKAPQAFTSARDDGDFVSQEASKTTHTIRGFDTPLVFVVKKNKSRLQYLRNWLLSSAERPEGHERIADIPLLIIDDEADQASIDTKREDKEVPSDEHDPSAINKQIRAILDDFDQSAYVAYTATPFANILIHDESTTKDVGLDLFPKDFIWCLEPPSNYIGPGTLFGFTSEYKEVDEEGLDLVRTFTDSTEWMPDKHDRYHDPTAVDLPNSVKEAINTFILTCATRLLREAKPHHNTMLVHVTRFIDVQEKVANQINLHLIDIRNQLLGDTGDSSARRELKELWEKDFEKTSKKIQRTDFAQKIELKIPLHTFKEVEANLELAVSRIKVKHVSSESSDVLDYPELEENETGHTYLVVGGDKLSRGLTLEGLCASYYGRPSKMYDTLMQMGRWFGYRPNYLDLCRIWTTGTIKSWYRSIALASFELMEEFKQMSREEMTPKDFGLKIRIDPKLMVTNSAKQRNGVKQLITFSGHSSGPRAFREKDRERDLRDVDELITSIKSLKSGENDSPELGQDIIFREVPEEFIREYLRKLDDRDAYPEASEFQPKVLLDYIAKRVEKGGLTSWTVVLKNGRGQETNYPIGGYTYRLTKREALKKIDGSDPVTYAIRQLASPGDEAIDLSSAELAKVKELVGEKPLSGHHYRKVKSLKKGLLVIYPVSDIDDPNQRPYTGIYFSLPNDQVRDGGEKVNYYMTNSVYQKYES